MSNGSSASLQTRVIKARLSDLKLLEKNARYMKGPQFERLVENIRRDGVLTSFPLVHREGEALEVISGNHRVSAAIKAGIEELDVIEVTTPLTRQQFVALQLSHNAIAGQDDPNILRSLYDELDFGWKEYSGLTDDAFDIEDLDASVLRVEQPFYEELTISFLPGDADVFGGWLDKIGSSKRAGERLVGLYEDFRVFFDQLLAVKAAKDVRNTAVALRLMAELAGQALADQEAVTQPPPPTSKRATRRGSARMRGNRPKPTVLKLITGNPGRRPLNAQEAKPAGSGAGAARAVVRRRAARMAAGHATARGGRPDRTARSQAHDVPRQRCLPCGRSPSHPAPHRIARASRYSGRRR